jgi:hypothetical protein
MPRILVRLDPDRNQYGKLTLHDGQGEVIAGPFPASGRASDGPAKEHRNETHDPLMRYGDTPAGTYRVSVILGSGEGTSYSARQYGPNGLIVLDPVSGDAALADANGRYHIFIQGGAAGRGRKLRSTNGCLRLFDADLAKVIEAIRELGMIECDCIEDPAVAGSGTVLIDNSYNEGDPPAVLEGDVAGYSNGPRKFRRRDVLRSAAVGTAAVMMQAIPLGYTIFVTRDRHKVADSIGFEGVAMAYGPSGSIEQGEEQLREQLQEEHNERANPSESEPEEVAPQEAPPSNSDEESSPSEESPSEDAPASSGPYPEGPRPEAMPPAERIEGKPAPAAEELQSIVPASKSAVTAPYGEIGSEKARQGIDQGAHPVNTGLPSVPSVEGVPVGGGAPAPVPSAVANSPEYQQAEQENHQAQQNYNVSVTKVQDAQANFKRIARDPNSTAADLQAADQQARAAEEARSAAAIQKMQTEEKVKAIVNVYQMGGPAPGEPAPAKGRTTPGGGSNQ